MKYLIAFLFLATPVVADQIELTRIPGTFAGAGGEFNITPLDGLSFADSFANLGPDSFQSFCLEHDENVTGGTAVYDYVVSTGATRGGVSGQTTPDFDPIDPLTAWMFTEFARGTLAGYDYGSGRGASAAALQGAIWYAEGELPGLPVGLSTTFYDAALQAAPTDIGGVRALNLYQHGKHRQDQIFLAVPEPSALIMCLTAIGMLFAFRRELV